MKNKLNQTRVLHVWDYRVDSGTNIDDRLIRMLPNQLSLSRVLVQGINKTDITQRALHLLSTMAAPYPKNRILRVLSKRYFIRFLRKEVKRFKPDLVYYHFGQTAASLIRPLQRFGIPFVVAFYGHDVSVALNQPRWLKKYKIFTQSAGAFLVLSDVVKARLKTLGINPKRVHVYNYPLDLAPYLKVIKTEDHPHFDLTIAGRLVEKKGHFILFRALEILKATGIEPHLTVIGYGEDWPLYIRETMRLGIDAQVEWIDSSTATIEGTFDALYCSVLEKTDLVVLPGITSSQGDDEAGPALVLCLAQATGTPVLTTPFAGHEISIKDGLTGYLVEEGNAFQLAQKLAWCIANPQDIKKVGDQGKSYVQSVFDQNTNLEIIINVIAQQISPTN